MKTHLTAADMRAIAHARYVADLRDGRRQRATTIPAKRGPGSYRRRDKHAGRREYA
jgi:hypothetical protein